MLYTYLYVICYFQPLEIFPFPPVRFADELQEAELLTADHGSAVPWHASNRGLKGFS